MNTRLHAFGYGIFALAFACSLAASAGEIHRAVKEQNEMKVREVLSRSPDGTVNALLGNDVSPLHLSAALGHSEITTLLILRGAAVNARTTGGFSPLHWAAGRDAADAVSVLIDMGADVNAAAANGITPLHWAAGKNATNSVRLLLVAGADVNAETTTRMTPLHWALGKHAEEASMLLAFQAASEEMAYEERPTAHDAIPPAVATNVTDVDADPGEVLTSSPRPKRPPAEKPLFGKVLVLTIGLGTRLELAWVESIGLWMGKYEVSNEEFRCFRPRHDSLFYETFSLNTGNQPAVRVNWNDAAAFCDWLNVNYWDKLPADSEFRLPTEKEWEEVASCGDDRRYPWGDAWPPAYGNFSDMTARMNMPNWRGISGYSDGYPVTCPVTESGENEWGIFGLAGNVWEWCADWFDDSQVGRVRRGGSWDFDPEASLRVTERGFDRPDARYNTIGFRVVVAPKD
ncbi:MAG: SUMF1/EgtB/PvdO family nonheme iron enzyme [Lentisphaerae bacterium]|nr:SUMF1/EgtB/PvdO family nonheme iron enzyme [Lentisphaerota bacterium]